jgi:glycine betaine/proline transport system substrate-binding protein
MSEVRTTSARTRRGRKLSGWQLLVALFAALGLLAAACTGSDQETAPEEPAATTEAMVEEEPEEMPADEGPDLGSETSITLAANPWNGSALNVAVAAQLLESEFGYDVEIVDIDENGQWPAINTSEISASLEVWPSGHAQNVTDFIDNADANVDHAGLLGPIGKIGWFIPTYMVERHPELATWEGFADPELAGLFATAETGDLGQFLGGDPSFVQYDEDIINNLGLPLQVVYAGSEAAILAAVDAAYSREEPILVYLWTPHSAFNSYDLTNVLLPEYSDDCYGTADDGGVDCDYPADVLFKIIDASLAENSPAADSFLRAMNYDSADQIAMLAAVEGEGMSVDDAAAQWIADNEATWSAWLQ